MEMETTDFLEHHGILGQKWGKKHGPPYPLDSKVSTGKSLRQRIADHKAGKIEAKKRKAKVKQLKKAREAQRKKREEAAQAAKKEAKRVAKNKKLMEKIKNNPKLLMKNMDRFTNAEIQAQLDRFNLQQKLMDVNKQKLERASEFIRQAANIAENLGRVYGVYQKVTGNTNQSKSVADQLRDAEALAKLKAIKEGKYDPYNYEARKAALAKQQNPNQSTSQTQSSQQKKDEDEEKKRNARKWGTGR